MIREWIDAGAASDWYNAANWTPPTGQADWQAGDIAQFKNSGTATSAQIDLSAGDLSLGAITVSDRQRDLTIGNAAAAANGMLQLNGATVNSIDNVILSSAVSGTNLYKLIMKDILPGYLNPLQMVLGNAVENIILVNGVAAAIDISAAITGAGKKLSLRSAALSGTLTLTGANTYTGQTTISAPHAILVLARPGGATLPASNDVYILNGQMVIKTDQTLRNIKIGPNGGLTIEPGVKFTLTGTLEMGTILQPEGGVRGTIQFGL